MNDTNRYARHIALAECGVAGQQRLAAASVLIVGLGGLGCPAALYLASSGVGLLHLVDFDRVDISNLPRQVLYRAGDVGELKVVVAARRLRELNPEVRVETTAERVTAAALARLIDEADLVLDCTDNFPARFAINSACRAATTPLISGAAVRLEGQVALFSQAPGTPCYRCVYDEQDEWFGDCQGNGVLASVTAVIGSLMAQEALLALLRAADSGLNNQLLLWDGKYNQWTRLGMSARPDCPVCGDA